MAGRKPSFNTEINESNRDKVETASENLRDAALMLFDAARNLEGADLKRSQQAWKDAGRVNALAFWMQAAVNRYDEANLVPSHECELRADGVSLCHGDQCAIEGRECDCGNLEGMRAEAAQEAAAEKMEVPA